MKWQNRKQIINMEDLKYTIKSSSIININWVESSEDISNFNMVLNTDGSLFGNVSNNWMTKFGVVGFSNIWSGMSMTPSQKETLRFLMKTSSDDVTINSSSGYLQELTRSLIRGR